MFLFLFSSCRTDDNLQQSEASFVTEQYVQEQIIWLGELTSEKERYVGLIELQELIRGDSRFEDLEADLEILLPVVDLWANGLENYWIPGEQESSGEGGYLGGFFLMRVFPGQEDNSYPPVLSKNAQLEPMWSLYRGRMLIWAAIENGLMSDSFYAEGRALLEQAQMAFPNNEVIAMYLGEKLAWETEEVPEGLPEWVELQHRSILALSEVVEFWVEERQADDGQFGGGWGDDVEMWRWWAPILLGYDDSKFVEAQRLLAAGIFDLERLSLGYTNMLIDVEHGSEDTADSLTPMLLLFPEDNTWISRALVLNDLMRDVWSEYNDLGHRHFKSSYLSSEFADDDLDKACDTPYHTRVIQPLLHLLQKGHLSEDQFILEWLSGWNAAVAMEGEGKPSGIPPAAIAYPSGLPFGEHWWNPGCHYVDTTFSYPRAFSMLGRAMLLAEHHTSNLAYMSSISGLVELRNAQIDGELVSEDEGSAGWAVDKIKGHLNDVLQKEWLLKGESADDDLLYDDGNSYVKYRLTGDVDHLLAPLSDTAQALSWNKPAYTSEVRFTDRVLKFHTRYWNDLGDERLPGVNTTVLYNMITGDLGDPTVFALPAVRWGFSHKSLRVNVEQSTENSLKAHLYSMSDFEDTGLVNLLRAGNGQKRYELSCANSSDEGVFSELSFELLLPPKELCVLTVEAL